MEFLFALPLFILPVILPFIAGKIARDSGRDYRFWFCLAIPLPFIAHFILLGLPDKEPTPIQA
jgi:hypothetical protein